jgi:hypothetical protein
MDIVKRLDWAIEWHPASKGPVLLKDCRDEIERLREEILAIWEMLEVFPCVLEVTNTGSIPTDKDHVDAMRKWNKGVQERILKKNASWLRDKALGGKSDHPA